VGAFLWSLAAGDGHGGTLRGLWPQDIAGDERLLSGKQISYIVDSRQATVRFCFFITTRDRKS
jgi:hypothetical protein